MNDIKFNEVIILLKDCVEYGAGNFKEFKLNIESSCIIRLSLDMFNISITNFDKYVEINVNDTHFVNIFIYSYTDNVYKLVKETEQLIDEMLKLHNMCIYR